MRIEVKLGPEKDAAFFFSKEKALRTILSGFSSYVDKGYVKVPMTHAYDACVYLKTLGNEVFGLPTTIANLKYSTLANALDVAVPNGADRSKLFPFQSEGVKFLESRRKALLAYEMGLGKTVVTLTALNSKLGALVVCPKVMVGTWYNEARKWRPDLVTRIHQRPYSIFPSPGELTIVSYSQLNIDDITLIEQRYGRPIPKWTGVDSGTHPTKPFTVVFDEAHYLKTPKAQRTLVVRAIAKKAWIVWLLTGTPLLNEPPELWTILEVAQAERDVFWSWKHFQDMFGAVRKTIWAQGQERSFIDHWDDTPSEEALKRLGCFMLRRTRKEVLPELPTKTYRDISIEISSKDMRELPLSQAMLDGMSDDAVLTACNEPGIISEGRAKLVMMKTKTLDALLDEYEAQGVPAVVFSYHRGPIAHVEKREGWKVITGDTTTGDRTAIIAQFQAGALKGVAGTIGAMGIGVTLVRAFNVIFVDQSYVPADNLQAEDRLCRIGQKNAVLVTRLVAKHPIDERVSQVLDKKMTLLENMGLA